MQSKSTIKSSETEDFKHTQIFKIKYLKQRT
jgi:hypothetical protein